ncbi:LuxR family transcriptional regulator [Dongia sedimenti]|uniref:LuxR family transcriptional regulator n=1 Tax=Dongia sedimenti TaxID=3064282 RepID=A0ABU0YU84_9PROT|nr:LuxR family transcriptional regulator [Rhodospirillaceae bacterium R-7]
MHEVFRRFVDRLTTRPDAAALGETLAETLTFLDIQAYAYLLIPDGATTARLISNYPPAWTDHYLAMGYEAIDPVIAEARNRAHSFVWGPGAAIGPPSEFRTEFFEEAARFGIRRGFTIPIHDGRSQVAALTLAADMRQLSFKRAIERAEAALELIATLFHRAARRTLAPELVVDGTPLAPREYECLALSAQGKTAWEIGVILGISQRTVVDYLERAKRKLGVFSIAEAVARLVASASRL